HLVMKKMK
ncbi:hypothetical protein ACTFIR_003975, partial [Dictyostelium discoideum]